MRRAVVVAVIAAVGIGAIAAGWPKVSDTVAWYRCVGHENDEFSRITDSTDELLAEVSHKATHLSTCEDSGRPRAILVAAFADWTRPREAREFLVSKGWSGATGRSLQSPGHDYAAQIISEREPDGSTRVLVYFSLA